LSTETAVSGSPENGEPVVEIVGRIKWFDSVKGYGFIKPASGGQGDILLHQSCIRQSGFKLAQEGARRSPEVLVFAPLTEADLFRMFLAAGFRTVKMMNLMTMGPYDPPSRVWIPSVMY